jgi:hypothetical protein
VLLRFFRVGPLYYLEFSRISNPNSEPGLP